MRYTGSPLEHGSKLFPDTPAYDVKAHLKHVQELHAKYPLNSQDILEQFIANLTAELTPRPWTHLRWFYSAGVEIFTDNFIAYPTCPDYELRSLLQRDEANLANIARLEKAADVLLEVFSGINAFCRHRYLLRPILSANHSAARISSLRT